MSKDKYRIVQKGDGKYYVQVWVCSQFGIGIGYYANEYDEIDVFGVEEVTTITKRLIGKDKVETKRNKDAYLGSRRVPLVFDTKNEAVEWIAERYPRPTDLCKVFNYKGVEEKDV